MGWSIPRILTFSLQLAVSAICLIYALKGIDSDLLRRAVKNYSIFHVAAAVLISILCIWLQALRLSLLFEPPLGLWEALRVTVLGLGLNNVLPAKGGEVLKVVYVNKSLSRPAHAAAAAVFFERFFDANCLYLLIALTLTDIAKGSLIRRMGVVFAVCWFLLIFFRCRPERFDAIWGAMPKLRGVKFFDGLKRHLLRDMTSRQLLKAWAATLSVWAVYFAYTVYALMRVGDFNISIKAAAEVFLISAAGQLLPTAPGSLGVFEASVVWGLSLFGVGQEPALGIAFLLRMIQLVPTLAALVVLFVGKAGFLGIKRKKD
ncbi:MAG: flippase-like domain-containing protein [Synergistaceae bacterium]|jgi:uncharacterized membrane protein YbhN (UPF0104 family)|nr:flippase-like domain-containing protein [Synergistaceae bacterium]